MSEQLRNALSPTERQFALLRSKYERGEELALEEGAKMVELEGKILFEQGVRDIKRVALEAGNGIDFIGTFVSRKIGSTVKEVGKKLAANMPDLNEKQQMMLKRLVELRAIEEGNEDIPLEVTAEIRTLESVLSMTQGVNDILKYGDNMINRVADLIADTFPSRRIAKLSPGLAMIVVGGIAGAACTGGTAFGEPRLTDTTGPQRTNTPMPTVTPTRTQRPPTATPFEQVDPTETAWPTPTPVKTETVTPEAKKVTVDAEGFMGDGNFHFRVDPDLYKGTKTEVYDGADRIFYSYLYRQLSSNPRFENLDWLKAIDPNAPWEGQWGKLEVVMPISWIGSGYVESVKPLVLDLSKPIYFDLRQRVTLDELQSGDSNIGDFFATGTIDGNPEVFVGLGLRIDEANGSIYVTYAEKGSTKTTTFKPANRDKYVTGWTAYPFYMLDRLVLGTEELKPLSPTHSIWNGFGDGLAAARSLAFEGNPLYEVIATSK